MHETIGAKEENSFDAASYRNTLLQKILAEKAEGDSKIARAKETDSEYEIVHAKADLYTRKRNILKLARWTQIYHRAKLLKNGRFTTDEKGEIHDLETGMTPAQLAGIQKLHDYFDYNIEDVLKVIDEQQIQPEQLQHKQYHEAAEMLFWAERKYRSGGINIEKAPLINRFVELFGLHDELAKVITAYLDYAIQENKRSYAEQLLAAYPVLHLTPQDLKAKFDARYYPMGEGLQKHTKLDLFFGPAFEGEGKEVPLGTVIPQLAANAQLLANDLKRDPDLYWALKKYALVLDNHRHTGRGVAYRVGRWDIQRDDALARAKGDKGRLFCRAKYFLGDDPSVFEDWLEARQARFAPRLEFLFSIDKEEMERDQKMRDQFTTTNIFRFDGLYVEKARLDEDDIPVEELPSHRIDRPEIDYTVLAAERVQKAALTELVDQLLKPRKTFERSIGPLRELAAKYGLAEEVIVDLTKAIEEFGTYQYRKQESDIGDCLSTPGSFNYFCIAKFGIKLDNARYGEYHPEWGNMGGYDPFTFLHVVSVFSRKIVIDWTVTQYADRADKPIPYIYEIGAERKSLGPLYKRHGEKSPNEQFINDPNDPLYREEEPISYEL